MRIAIVGPSHPYKGGIVLHTTQLAHELQKAGHQVEVFSWKRQYPGFLYPGQKRLMAGEPEMPVFESTHQTLNWYDPSSWWRVGRRLRQFELVIFPYWLPQFQGIPGLVMLRAMGVKRPRTVAICHNVLPHESRPGDKQITKAFLSRVDAVVVHTDVQAKLARQFTQVPVRIAAMAPHLPVHVGTVARHDGKLRRHLLFFGQVRQYKGVDILLRALTQAPGISLTIAGEASPKMLESLKTLIGELKLGKRVKLKPDYIPSNQIGSLFIQADALVLAYRSGTATQNVAMGFAHGVPVIGSDVPAIASHIKSEVNGLVFTNEDVQALSRAIKHLYDPGVLERLRKGLPDPTSENDRAWADYIQILLSR